jgi:hypothetical protein
MSDSVEESAQYRRPHPQSMAAAYLECDLTREVDQLHREPGWASGQDAKTLITNSPWPDTGYATCV